MTPIEASRQVIGLVRADKDNARHHHGCSPDTIARAEREMGLTFPPSYRLLIEEFGTWEVPPTEFLDGGLMERLANSYGEFALAEWRQKLN
ncbi:SMI1/KNR4 family protein [Streptomyces sp. NPDC058469]|uniref:SMI1/KNR4 family protein n=1 Tax=Streptomyces sp. NPDC058469 TaxID=3346514 RepID=UPI0036671B27